MLCQWACSGTPGGGRCFPDHRFLANCHLLGTSSPDYLGSLEEDLVTIQVRYISLLTEKMQGKHLNE